MRCKESPKCECIQHSAALYSLTNVLMFSKNDEGEAVSRSVHLIGSNDVLTKPSILLRGLMRGGPGGQSAQAPSKQRVQTDLQ